MVKSLEEYLSETSSAYEPTRQALQNQLNSVDSQLETTNQNINRDYAQQQAQLNTQRNQAAESASLQAAGSGGSFGGASNIANRKYYDQTFVPAQTQLQTNQANALAEAAQNAENQRTNLNTQLAQLQQEANTYGISRYDSDRQAEAQLAAQNAATAAQNAYYEYIKKVMDEQNQANTAKSWDFGNGYTLTHDDNNNAVYKLNGNNISAGKFLSGTGLNGSGVNWDLWNDVWNNGVSTTGVGSDTVAAFSPSNYANMLSSANNSKYAYLY